MFIVALFPVTLQVAPDQNRRPNASAVNVNNFSISTRTISIRANKMAASRNKGKRGRGRRKGVREEATAKNWRRRRQDGEEGAGAEERDGVKVVRMLSD